MQSWILIIEALTAGLNLVLMGLHYTTLNSSFTKAFVMFHCHDFAQAISPPEMIAPGPLSPPSVQDHFLKPFSLFQGKLTTSPFVPLPWIVILGTYNLSSIDRITCLPPTLRLWDLLRQQPQQYWSIRPDNCLLCGPSCAVQGIR